MGYPICLGVVRHLPAVRYLGDMARWLTVFRQFLCAGKGGPSWRSCHGSLAARLWHWPGCRTSRVGFHMEKRQRITSFLVDCSRSVLVIRCGRALRLLSRPSV